MLKPGMNVMQIVELPKLNLAAMKKIYKLSEDQVPTSLYYKILSKQYLA